MSSPPKRLRRLPPGGAPPVDRQSRIHGGRLEERRFGGMELA